MDSIQVPASITIEKGIKNQKYKWKSKNKTSVYRKESIRAVLRITALNFIKNTYRLGVEKRQVKLKIIKSKGRWLVHLHRTKKGVTLQSYYNNHPYLQIVVNKTLPQEFREEYKRRNKKTVTFPVRAKLHLKEWEDIKLKISDFLMQVEKEPKLLLEYSIQKGFESINSEKGRAYDLHLKSRNNNEFIIAITSYGGKSSEIRRKEKIKQKIILDIAKILPSVISHKNIIPVVVSRPMESKKTWSYTTSDYLGFYKEKFNFKFLTTNFKNGWERHICNKLLELDKNGKI